MNRIGFSMPLTLFALALLVLACTPTAPASTKISVEGTYTAKLPAADAPGREMTLALNADKSCTLTADYVGKPEKIVEKGTWSRSGNTVTVMLTDLGGRPHKNEMTFEIRGNQLVAIKWDRNFYGSVGPGTYEK
jgi:uncharacterized lipoprotein NlpE involved in copper resistance